MLKVQVSVAGIPPLENDTKVNALLWDPSTLHTLPKTLMSTQKCPFRNSTLHLSRFMWVISLAFLLSRQFPLRTRAVIIYVNEFLIDSEMHLHSCVQMQESTVELIYFTLKQLPRKKRNS